MNAKAPWWFWLVALLATLWNSGGVMDFTMTHTRNEAYMAAYTEAQRAYFYGYPLWASAVWAMGVFGAFLGAILLFFRSRFAFHAFIISLTGMVLSFSYQFFSEAPDDLYNFANMAFTAAIWLVAVLLLWYSVAMQKRGILR
jgi:uncharacterized membrane protein